MERLLVTGLKPPNFNRKAGLGRAIHIRFVRLGNKAKRSVDSRIDSHGGSDSVTTVVKPTADTVEMVDNVSDSGRVEVGAING